MTIEQRNAITDSITNKPFAWPGGYERFAITDDGGVLCYRCVTAERETIEDSFPGDGWFIVGQSHDGETDALTICDHCGTVIVEDWEEE